jgi:hypothetical protein
MPGVPLNKPDEFNVIPVGNDPLNSLYVTDVAGSTADAEK